MFWEFLNVDNLFEGLETFSLLILVMVFLPTASDCIQESKRISGAETNKLRNEDDIFVRENYARKV